MLGNTEPKPSPQDRAHPRSGEGVSSNKAPANGSPCLSIPPFQLFDCSKKEQVDVQIGANGLTPTNWVSVSTEDDVAQHRGRSRMRHHRRSRTVSHTTSKSRIRSPPALAGLGYDTSPVGFLGVDGTVQSASSQPSSHKSSAGFVAPRPRAASRFSYEDYKHTQIMGWLEGRVIGKEVNYYFRLNSLVSD
jgi:hypothetical protein